jgi:hypothetical protein
MSKVIRFILTLAFVYGAYTETGVFTALSLLVIFVAIELQGWLTKRALDGGTPREVGDLTPDDVREKMASLAKPRRQ